MPEAILIVDGTATNRKLTHRVLSSAGYDVRSVADATAALHAISQFQPKLILTDLQLDGMDGIALTRHIKDDPQTRQTLVIAVTGCGTDDDRDAALHAGCDDFILKPIDTRALPIVVQAHLTRQEQDAISVEAAAAADLPSWALELCNEFLHDGGAKVRSLADTQAAPEEIKRSAHMWAGLGGTFGFPEITKLARQLEDLLRAPSTRNSEIARLLERLEALFSRAAASSAHVQASPPLSPALVQSLSGKTFALVGFDTHDAARLARALEAAGVAVAAPSGAIAECDLTIASADSEETSALLKQTRGAEAQPLLLVGTRRRGPEVERMLNSAAFDFAATPWTVEEIFARSYRLLAGRQSLRPTSQTPERDRKIRLVLADDDPTVLTLLRTTMESYGMECAVASEGDKALELMRANPPDAAILDIIMPNMDGLEVLAAIRNDPLLKNVRVLLVSALQQESDIVRALGLGADDYVTKPFSPVEVVARLKRLVRSDFLTRSESFGRNVIYVQSLSVAVGYILSVYLMDVLYVHHHIEDSGLAFGYAFCLVEGCVISILLILSLVIKFVRHRREARWLRLQPSIVQETSAHLSGVDNINKLLALRKRHPREVEQSMLDMLLRVRGTTLERLSDLILDLGLVERWKRQYGSRIAATRRTAISRLGMLVGSAGHNTLILALEDTNDEVKLEASRSLISAGKVPELEAVFRTAVRDSLLVRAILTEALRPYAPLLYESAVPEAFSSGDPKTVRIALEIVWAWRKSLPLDCVQPLLHHPDGAVRAAALAIVPQLVTPLEFESELIESLSDDAEAVRAAAADAAGKLRLSSALPALKACLERGGADATVAAAYALTHLGAQGWHILEEQVLNSRSMAASAALEAIEQARSERWIPGIV